MVEPQKRVALVEELLLWVGRVGADFKPRHLPNDEVPDNYRLVQHEMQHRVTNRGDHDKTRNEVLHDVTPYRVAIMIFGAGMKLVRAASRCASVDDAGCVYRIRNDLGPMNFLLISTGTLS